MTAPTGNTAPLDHVLPDDPSAWTALDHAVATANLRGAIIAVEREDAQELREIVEYLVRQFAYPGRVMDGAPSLTTGGMSALESAFSMLGWSDPYPCPEGACAHPGCAEWATCGTPTPDGYKRLCYTHYDAVQPRDGDLDGAGEGEG